MPASYTLSSDARRSALQSSFSPKLPDASQFPLSVILAKLPPLPDDPLLDAPGQLVFPTPPTPPTPGLDDDDDDNDNDLPQASQASTSSDLRPAFNFETVPLPPDDLDDSASASDNSSRLKTDNKKRFSVSRSVSWWTRFDDGKRPKTDKVKDKTSTKRFLGSRSVAWWTRFPTRA
ncbi:hypothetical protein GSI_05550 [Ganoderma sinense ZZ0214-1]|uniref:Uncharacterized protein n=1 Tax=Ganoderma sinense ZZ0214-1 TaxID=1077348 RepID=A0A2G8SEU9_9APHY|nr:hypothetical protein GSI_05550 [Ganoderma sinense ZZ0214-1]